jgi:hypothetical protein
MPRPVALVTYIVFPSGLKRAPIAPTASGSVPSSVTLADLKRAAAWADGATSRPTSKAANAA